MVTEPSLWIPTTTRARGSDLQQAIYCLSSLGRSDEIDAFREAVIQVHKENWRLLASGRRDALNDRRITASSSRAKFHRGPHRGGGRYVNAHERDRVRALQLLVQGLDRRGRTPIKPRGPLLAHLGRALLVHAGIRRIVAAAKPDHLDALPDHEEAWVCSSGTASSRGARGARWDPVYYRVPQGFAQAKNDGERWRWALAQAVEVDPGLLNADASRSWRSFLLETVRHPDAVGNGCRSAMAAAMTCRAATRIRLHTLKDDETIARLATGIKRFKLPDEFNWIKIYQTIADDRKTGQGEQARDQPGVDLREPPPVRPGGRDLKRSHERVRRPQGGWQDAADSTRSSATGASSSRCMTQPAGKEATVDFRFRNGRRSPSRLTTSRWPSCSSDVKAYLASQSRQLDWQQDQHQQHRLPPGRAEPAAVPGRSSPLGPGPEAARRPRR